MSEICLLKQAKTISQLYGRFRFCVCVLSHMLPVQQVWVTPSCRLYSLPCVLVVGIFMHVVAHYYCRGPVPQQERTPSYEELLLLSSFHFLPPGCSHVKAISWCFCIETDMILQHRPIQALKPCTCSTYNIRKWGFIFGFNCRFLNWSVWQSQGCIKRLNTT